MPAEILHMSEPIDKEKDASSAQAAHALQGSNQPRPRHVPPPTFWPFVTAVGLTGCCWGIVTRSTVVIAVAGIFVVGIGGLIGDWIREHRSKST